MIKKITSILLAGVLLSLYSYGQKTFNVLDSNTIGLKNLCICYTGGFLYSDTMVDSYSSWRSSYQLYPSLDTSRIIMLVSDTNQRFVIYNNDIFPAFTPSYLQYGYVATSDTRTGRVFLTYPEQVEGELKITYLDADKKPLPKNTIIWFTQKIKQ